MTTHMPALLHREEYDDAAQRYSVLTLCGEMVWEDEIVRPGYLMSCRECSRVNAASFAADERGE